MSFAARPAARWMRNSSSRRSTGLLRNSSAPQGQAGHPIVDRVPGGDDDDGNPRKLGIGPEEAADAEAVAARHLDIEQYE